MSIIARPAAGARLVPPQLEIPQLSLWPENLPDAVPMSDGTFLPTALDKAVQARLLECESLPDLYAATTEQSNKLWQALADEAVALERRNIYANAATTFGNLQVLPEDRSGWPTWQVALLVGASIAGGLMVGFFAGYAYAGMAAK